jgi:hypothetical protein
MQTNTNCREKKETKNGANKIIFKEKRKAFNIRRENMFSLRNGIEAIENKERRIFQTERTLSFSRVTTPPKFPFF